VTTYELKNADTPNFYALVTRADLTEISLTDARPRVLNRYRPSAASEVYALIGEKVKLMTSVLKEI